MRRRSLLAGLAAVAAGPVWAQGSPSLPIVVLDREALFARSRFGQRVRADIEAASNALVAENRRIEEELEAEEQDLTAQRATTDPLEFRALAEAFDRRVQGIRQAQEAKGRAITTQTERAQQIFIERAGPVLADLAGEVGALVILDRRMVIASSDQVDITQLAVARIDAALGAGETERIGPSPRPSPEAAPAPAPDPEAPPAASPEGSDR